MKCLVLLFIFTFSPLAFCVSGYVGKTKIDKLEMVMSMTTPKTVKEEIDCDSLSIAIKTLSDWQIASGSYYDPKDTAQTKPVCDGKGAFERMVQSGSIALGSSFTKFFVKEKEKIAVFIEIKNLDIVTPFGKGIFRLDDKMGKSYSVDKSYFLDFHEVNLTPKLKRIGRFNILFRIHRIQKI